MRKLFIYIFKILGNFLANFYISARDGIARFLNRRSQIDYRKHLNLVFKLRDSIFFKKKVPVSENYPFTLIDPFEIFGEENPYGDFNLLGEDWRDKSNSKPVAIFWGFNNWKWGFASAYLPEYRTAFAPRKMLPWLSLIALRRFPIKPAVFIFWGYTESWIVRHYAKLKNIKIYRMEDGFIRSSALGATHSTPYSLVLDSRGSHCNPNEPSDLEDILNYHDFTEDELSRASECMELMQSLRLSKYNPATLGLENVREIKTRRRVAVLGQVDNDMAMRLGNPHGWSMIELIRMAKIENPDADIYYRPHPEVFRGFQKSRFRQRAVEKFCKLVSPDVPLVDFLDTLDHVYTVTSLSGLEALIRGVKVTVVGGAFYAGWGLTDDRVAFPRRKRVRSLLELFAAVYLKYPRYLANVSDNEIGFKAACYRIKADLEIEEFKLFDALTINDQKSQYLMAASDYWPMLLFKKLSKSGGDCSKNIVGKIDFGKLLGPRPGRIFQISLLYAVCGVCADNAARDAFIGKIRGLIDRDILNELLLDLNKTYSGTYVSRHMAWLLAEADEDDVSLEVLVQELKANNSNQKYDFHEKNASHSASTAVNDQAEGNDGLIKGSSSKSAPDILMEIFDHNVSIRQIDEAIAAAKKMLLEGFFVTKVILKLAQVALIRFDKESAKALAELLTHVDIFEQNKTALMVGMSAFTESDVENDAENFIKSLLKLVSLKSDRVSDAVFTAKKFEDFHSKRKYEEIICDSLKLDNEQSIQKALGFLALEDTESAISIIENLIRQGEDDDALRVAYSQTLSYAGRLPQALSVMREARSIRKTSLNFRESLRLCVLAGIYDEGLRLLEEAQLHKIELGDMHPRKIHFGARMVKEAFRTFTELSLRNTVATYYKDKYCTPQVELSEQESLFLLAIFGPGDEIRFASIYNLIEARLPKCKIRLACSPRLLTLFERSFPQFEFVPVARPRNSDLIDVRNYSTVPGSDLTGVIDDVAVAAIAEAKGIMLLTDLLHECLESYDDFPGVSYLKHDANLVEYYRTQLPQQKLLIGLSWRSSLTTHSRNEHYLTVEELEPIFLIDGIQFVNFQYDECQAELDWVEARYPGKLINISEIDQYNDFESVAALMKCMDLMIAPATTVVELAGALGCPTWLISNSSELFWRKIDNQRTDVWHTSITHVEAKELGNKQSLVIELCEHLNDFVLSKSVRSVDQDKLISAS